MAELSFQKGEFSLLEPVKLFCQDPVRPPWQKNWVPFEWDNQCMLSYSIEPHEILYPNLRTGECYPCYCVDGNTPWDYGVMRGGTPAIKVDGEYLAFFHSSKKMVSNVSFELELWHYFMGAYTFSLDPPFAVTKISPTPIIQKGFYTHSPYYKRVIFPGGFVVKGPRLYLAYGRDDHEIWIATVDLRELKNSLIPLKNGEIQ